MNRRKPSASAPDAARTAASSCARVAATLKPAPESSAPPPAARRRDDPVRRRRARRRRGPRPRPHRPAGRYARRPSRRRTIIATRLQRTQRARAEAVVDPRAQVVEMGLVRRRSPTYDRRAPRIGAARSARATALRAGCQLVHRRAGRNAISNSRSAKRRCRSRCSSGDRGRAEIVEDRGVGPAEEVGQVHRLARRDSLSDSLAMREMVAGLNIAAIASSCSCATISRIGKSVRRTPPVLQSSAPKRTGATSLSNAGEYSSACDGEHVAVDQRRTRGAARRAESPRTAKRPPRLTAVRARRVHAADVARGDRNVRRGRC